MKMPIIDLDAADITDDERILALEILKPDGRLYASKPGKASGEGKYLWRMVVWGVSPHRQHQCMPMTADWDLDGEFEERMARAKVLDELAQRIEATVPSSNGMARWRGAMRWGRSDEDKNCRRRNAGRPVPESNDPVNYRYESPDSPDSLDAAVARAHEEFTPIRIQMRKLVDEARRQRRNLDARVKRAVRSWSEEEWDANEPLSRRHGE